MKRILLVMSVVALMAAMLAVMAVPAFATIHPIVESADCANANAGDPAEVPGQDPTSGNHSDQSSLRALTVTSNGFTDPNPAWSDFKLNGQCGKVGQ